MSALKNKGMYLLDPESANGYSIGAAIGILDSVRNFPVHGMGELLQFRSPADCLRR